MDPLLALFLASAFTIATNADQVSLANVLDGRFYSFVPNEYILEMSEVNMRRSVSVYHSIRSEGISFDVTKEWDEPDILEPKDALRIAQLPDVRAIRPVSKNRLDICDSNWH
ncbi:hypothetical protein K435DRAFT_843142 [Dendrothele bispora CBS 962.96]|uniref:Uncharacterized protein n=1 Tax=Dendrothele bispora (strain CBS 962.96) TaxID=1314807 RepID=A0A4S8LA69_DENBC|nr:hypothetical protein K435DRAFT_843142 [Dendrothele bispora CBS 962.96]